MQDEQTVSNIELFLKKLDELKITKYKLHKLTGFKRSTVYAYCDGRLKIPASKCMVLADAIGVQITEVFPQLKTTGPELIEVAPGVGGYDPTKLGDCVDQVPDDKVEEIESGNLPIIVNDMVAGAATLLPEDGLTLKSRKILTTAGAEYEALSVQNEMQVIIKTGVKASNLNLNKIIIKGIKKHMVENECHVVNTPIDMNSELCVLLYVHGKPLMLYRGIEVARLMFL